MVKKIALSVAIIFLLCCLQPTEVQKEVIRVSHQPGWHHVALFVIVEKGWDEKIMKKKILTTSFPSGSPQMESFVAKEHDIAYVGAAPPLSIIAKGFGAKIVAVANVEGSSLIAIPEFEFRGKESINGKKIMTYPPGSIQQTILSIWLKENNISAEVIYAKGAAEIREALRTKSVDLAFVPDPTPSIAFLEGYGKIVLNSSEMFPLHPCCVVLMSEEFIKNRDLAAKFIALHIIASEYAIDPKNSDEISKILVKWLKIDEKVAKTFPGTTNLYTDPRDKVWLQGLEILCKAQFELGITKNLSGEPLKLNTSDIVDQSLYEEALKLVPKIKAELGL
ncbi:MAG: ABC transporter substrate-binding protein [Archaeoglobaceae archaeon]